MLACLRSRTLALSPNDQIQLENALISTLLNPPRHSGSGYMGLCPPSQRLVRRPCTLLEGGDER